MTPGIKAESQSHKEYEVAHYRQRYNWDCGVSCILMLLSHEDRENFLNRFHEICEEEGFGESTWTIDLCYLLKRFKMKHTLYTITIGLNEDYKRHGYYNKIMDLDRDRVNKRFKDAASLGVSVKEQSVTTDQLVSHLLSEGPAVVLVDGGLLTCDLCKHNKLKAEFRRCFGSSYKGHYILVVGFCASGTKLLYRDPALSARLCAISRLQFQRARLASGTDEDIILIHDFR